VTALIIPAPEQAAQVARDLLSLAQSPFHVQTNTDSGLAFVVPEYLAELYAETMSLVQPAAPEQPAARKRGRPRKEA
jgi:hypothetical protein